MSCHDNLYRNLHPRQVSRRWFFEQCGIGLGSMALGKNAVLGIALGTSTAGGYVTPEGNITSWLNELAFVPVDYNPNAAADEHFPGWWPCYIAALDHVAARNAWVATPAEIAAWWREREARLAV